MLREVGSLLGALGVTLKNLVAHRSETIEYPEVKRPLAPRYRARIVLTRDPEGEERCVACYLCSSVCPVGCIALEAGETEQGRRYPVWFRINFSRCIFCGFCEEACPTHAIQLTPDFELATADRDSLVVEKDRLLVDGMGKYPGYDFYRRAGVAIEGKRGKGEGIGEAPPTDPHDLMP